MKIRQAKKISKNLVKILQTNDYLITLIYKISMLNNTKKKIDLNKKAFKVKSKIIKRDNIKVIKSLRKTKNQIHLDLRLSNA